MNKFWTLVCLFFLIMFGMIDIPADWPPPPVFFIQLVESAAIALLLVLLGGFAWTKALAWKQQADKQKNEGKEYFKGIKLSIAGMVVFYIALVSVITWGMFIFRTQEQFFFDLATAIIISWIVMVIVYYIWAIFFYNVNMGWDEDDWEKLDELKKAGEDLPSDEPTENPHAKETLGLPPGTVRGTVAVSLLVAGLAMLIASFQLDQTYDSNSLFVDNFEFLKTAFLMMIAFYFGDKSLKAIGERNQGVYRPNGAGSGGGAQSEGNGGVPGSSNPSPSPVVSPDLIPPTDAADVQELKETLQSTGSETTDDGDTKDFNEKDSVG